MRLDVGPLRRKERRARGARHRDAEGTFYGKNLKALVERGEVALTEVDESVRRIVRTKLHTSRGRTRRRTPPAWSRPPRTSRSRARWPRRAWSCSRTMTPLLPLDKAKIKRLAVVGHLADAENTGDHGSSNVMSPNYTSALKGLRDHLGAGATILHSEGPISPRSAGRRGRRRGRGRRRSTLGRGGRVRLRRRGMRPSGPAQKRPLRVKLPLLHPIEISGGDYVPLALEAAGRGGHPGRLAGESALRRRPGRRQRLHDGGVAAHRPVDPDGLVLRHGGRTCARARAVRGRQPERPDAADHAEDEQQLPFFDEFADAIEYGPYHGYTLLDQEGREPAFAFGHGLSYTTYAYANLSVRRRASRPTARWR